MAWRDQTVLEQRLEFISFCLRPGANIRELCRRYEVSPTIAYKWMARFQSEGVAGLEDRPRRRLTQPQRTEVTSEAAVLEVRDSHPVWGARKIAKVLASEGSVEVPALSTITAILRRHGRLGPAPAAPGPFQHFERGAPNELWQMDFKGHFALAAGRCHPLTILDDHSRFALTLHACLDEQEETVRRELERVFRCYGLPQCILADRGSPWGADEDHPYTRLTVWLLRLEVKVTHGRPYHPQTQGKIERFHRTLKAELLTGRQFASLSQVQVELDRWRQLYNHQRPHQALDMEVPASRYQPSPRGFPEQLPALEYGPDDQVRRVQQGGVIHFRNWLFKIGKAFVGQPVALRPTTTDGLYDVFFGRFPIKQADLREANTGDPAPSPKERARRTRR
jgi:transposase InsO family protein